MRYAMSWLVFSSFVLVATPQAEAQWWNPLAKKQTAEEKLRLCQKEQEQLKNFGICSVALSIGEAYAKNQNLDICLYESWQFATQAQFYSKAMKVHMAEHCSSEEREAAASISAKEFWNAIYAGRCSRSRVGTKNIEAFLQCRAQWK